jgi:hypothetical protein
VSDFTQMSHSGRLAAFPHVDRAAICGSDVMGRKRALGTPMSYTKVATRRYANHRWRVSICLTIGNCRIDIYRSVRYDLPRRSYSARNSRLQCIAQ